MKKRFLSLLAVLLLGGQTVQAIDNDTAIVTALGGAATIAGIGYKMAQSPGADKQLVAVVTAGAAAVWVVGTLLILPEYWTYRKIEKHLNYVESKGKWARRKEMYRHENYLFNVAITDANFDTVLQEADCESVDFPLIEMFKKLQGADAKLIQLRNLSNTAMFRTRRKQSSFYQKLVAQRVRLDAIIKRVRGNISVIKQHRLWVEQWKMYQTKEIAFGKVQLQLAGHSERGA